MKDIENYVCTLDQAKWLKELGVEQNSFHWWVSNHSDYNVTILYDPDGKEITSNPINPTDKPIYSAFTSQELGELINRIDRHALICRDKSFEFLITQGHDGYCYEFESNKELEAQARAEFLIHLLEIK